MRATQKSCNPWRAWVAGGAAGSGELLGLLEPDLPGLSCSWGGGNGAGLAAWPAQPRGWQGHPAAAGVGGAVRVWCRGGAGRETWSLSQAHRDWLSSFPCGWNRTPTPATVPVLETLDPMLRREPPPASPHKVPVPTSRFVDPPYKGSLCKP